MKGSTMLTLFVSFITDFIISAGGALIAGMTATKVVDLPSVAVVVVAGATGLIAGARRVQALLQLPPQ